MRSDEVIIRELMVREDPNLRRTWSPLCCVPCVCVSGKDGPVTRVANILAKVPFCFSEVDLARVNLLTVEA
jgi:hypothetical protein